MRLGRLTADATIAFDGDVASKPVARPSGLPPAALTRLPASIFAVRRYAPGAVTEAALPLIR
jgi:hypothetical protein